MEQVCRGHDGPLRPDGADRRPHVLGREFGTTSDSFIDPLSDTTAYVGRSLAHRDDLYLTRDGGVTFARVAALPRAFRTGFELTFPDRRVGYAVTDQRRELYRTVDGGRTWTLVPPPD